MAAHILYMIACVKCFFIKTFEKRPLLLNPGVRLNILHEVEL